MWDYKAPLQLLQTMPKKLNQEHLEKLQMLINADKYKNSLLYGYDLCGGYAPFCTGCNKTGIYPCAISYINMLRHDGMDIELEFIPMPVQQTAEPVQTAEPAVAPVRNVEAKPYESPVQEQVAATYAQPEPVQAPQAVAEPEIREEQPVVEAVAQVEEPVAQPVVQPKVKHKIRIAVARKKL